MLAATWLLWARVATTVPSDLYCTATSLNISLPICKTRSHLCWFAPPNNTLHTLQIPISALTYQATLAIHTHSRWQSAKGSMVYRGKPSAGCEHCRKAKKRCTLEQPACERCVKLKKQCSGYRDTTQLQIQDESESVRQKAIRSKAKQYPPTTTTVIRQNAEHGYPTPGTTNSDSSSGSDLQQSLTFDVGANDFFYDDLDDVDEDDSWLNADGSSTELVPMVPFGMASLLKPNPEQLATNFFFKQFTSSGHWQFLHMYARQPKMDPCLDLAMRACGMAALDNIEHVAMGKDYARTMYVEALGLLNTALRDPKRSKTDEALIAVAMLSYYENLTCDSRESIQSWKAHISGATQLLKIRGRDQFKSPVGRMLFRETRAQIMIHCIWDDIHPPSFLWEWEGELEKQTPDLKWIKPADTLTKICFDFAELRANMRYKSISDAMAAEEASDIDSRMIQWSIDAMNAGEMWRYYDIEVPDSPHVWNGIVHAYSGHPAPNVWNTFRSIRIMVVRTQELLCHRFQFSDGEREEQTRYFRKVRRQMTDEICAGIPSALGHASPAYNSPCTLISAYSSIWPLFFAGTCALERVSFTAWQSAQEGKAPSLHQTSAASAQAAWILGRLEYISTNVGLKWANGIAAVLKGDFRIHDDLLPE